ncbi:MAG TPA: proline--tRNA ligase [Bacillota bacterium]|nr:proline--tRNA ligase [Bacillota bacterium]
MRLSEMFIPTLREVPAEAEITSHKLMLRAALMRKTMAGVYTYLPLGWKTIRKVEQIVREEMDRQGGQELFMPALQNPETWQRTGRYDDYGSEMFKFKDRGGREVCLGPTHEENVTTHVADEVRSYRQLPKLLYQIQTKFRDEIRPRYGVMRGREFIMKDLYSFDADQEGLDRSFDKMYEAYCRAFTRMGLEYLVVEADSGAIGGKVSKEYMAVAEIGEADIVVCPACGYGANVERAEITKIPQASECTCPPMSKVSTPDTRTIEHLEKFLSVPASRMIKTLVYLADGKPAVALVRGDRELNELKLRNALGAREVALADEETITKVTGAPVGFAGPVGIDPSLIIADYEIPAISCAVSGANEKDAHYRDLCYLRDFGPLKLADLRNAVEGDACPECGRPLVAKKGIEVGHLFKLGTKYSVPLSCNYLDDKGESHPMVMGCYGIGITRCVAAIIEQHSDEKGIIWPMSVAPAHCIVVIVNTTDERQMQEGEELYRKLISAGVEVIIDDRDERPGVKFNDADLIGIPIRVTVGPKALEKGCFELKMRAESQMSLIEKEKAVDRIKAIIASEMQKLEPAKR